MKNVVTTFKITAVCVSETGESFFQDHGELNFKAHFSLEGNPDGWLSPFFESEKTIIHCFTEGTFEDWHNVKLGEACIIIFAGSQQITVSSGEERIFTLGDILWLQDTRGKGHQTKMLSSGYSTMLIKPKGIENYVQR